VSNQADGVQALGLRDRAQWRGVLRTPFRNLWFSNLTSSLGDWVGIVAILALTEQILDSPRLAAFAMSGIMIARVVPTMILGPVAGVFVDRWDRRRLMITTHIGRGLVLAMVPFAGSVWALILATLLLEIQSTLFIPPRTR
jgi:dTMP kinase